ncbi:MAG: polysaccharide biosynthesis/export family protein [Cytophagia bacterium]|nr:polysaccharide biosynthesis/export family protein [Cytophagia bacterium]
MKNKENISPLVPKLMGFLFVVLLASSCIPNEKIVYMQNKGEDVTLNNDSLIALSRVDYRLQPNDILLINFYASQEDEVSKYYPIFARPDNMLRVGNQGNNGGLNDPYLTGYNLDRDGMIEINSLGKVKAAGLTTIELKKKIEDMIKEDVKDIGVSVKLSGIPFTIYGEVNNPGPQLVRQYDLTLLEAIARAGDLTINANRNHVLIMRQYPDGVKIHEVDVTGREFIRSELFFVQPDDLIYVAPLKIREIGTGETGLQTFATIVSVVSGTVLILSVLSNN